MAPHIFGKEVLPRLIQPLELSKQITLRQCPYAYNSNIDNHSYQ